METSHSREKRQVQKILKDIKGKKSDFWMRERERQSLSLFHRVAKKVPAYKDFLQTNKINPDKINTWADFQFVLPVSKKDYLRKYSLEKLCWGGTLKKPLVFTATSGSTGEPFYFPRGKQLDWQYSVLIEKYLIDSSYNKNQGPILVVIGFGMGVWIGGLITYKAFEIAGIRSNLPISIITPGVNKTEIIKALRNLAPNFKQVILVGYPPFLKDVIDLADSENIDFTKINLRLLSAAEAFTENFRNYLIQKTKINNLYKDTMNIYGSADMGAMAAETPGAILIRRAAMNNKELFEDIFSSIDKTPTLTQFNPQFINFESSDGEILLTGDNEIPLVRYAIGDHGGVLSFDDVVKRCKNNGIDINKEADKYDVGEMCEMPLVYVHERNDFSTTLYGLQIYPEFLKEALIDNVLSQFLTGKFTMVTKYSQNQDQYLEINIELRKSVKVNKYINDNTYKNIIDKLSSKSSEFKELLSHIKDKPLIELKFWLYEHKQYFKPGIKQKWVRK